MGHTIWVNSDGTWTTQLSLDGKVQQHTLSMLTLCPLWKKRLLSFQLWGKITQEETDPWRHSSTGTKVGWMLEAISRPQMTLFQNHMWLYNLSGQVKILANATRRGYRI